VFTLLTQEELEKKNNPGPKGKGKAPKKQPNDFFDQLKKNTNSQVGLLHHVQRVCLIY
jgi:hypothetical protein